MKLRVVLLLLVIFASGVWVGHLATERWGGEGEELAWEEEVDDEADSTTEAIDAPPTRREMIQNTKRVAQRYRDSLQLTEEQVEALRPYFIEAGKAMMELPSNSPLRIGVLEQLHREIRPLLDDEQKVLSDEIVRQSRERMVTLGGQEE